MKRHVQVTGVRYWAGDDFLELQGESLKILDKFYGQFGPFVLSGCEVSQGEDDYNVAPGLVVLDGKDPDGATVRLIAPFAGAENTILPIYLTLSHEIIRRPYLDGGNKPIVTDYKAVASTLEPEEGPYLKITENGGLRFIDAIQDSQHRFITDVERDMLENIVETIKKFPLYRGLFESDTNANDLIQYGIYELRLSEDDGNTNFPSNEDIFGIMEVSVGVDTVEQTIKANGGDIWFRHGERTSTGGNDSGSGDDDGGGSIITEPGISNPGKGTGAGSEAVGGEFNGSGVALAPSSTVANGWRWYAWQRIITQAWLDAYDPNGVNHIKIVNKLATFSHPKYLLCNGSVVMQDDYPDLKGTAVESNGTAWFPGTIWPTLSHVFSENGYYVAISQTGNLYISTSGLSWTDLKQYIIGGSVVHLALTSGRFVMIDSTNNIRTSINGGVSWGGVGSVPSGWSTVRYMTYAGSRYRVIGDDFVAESSNGASWTTTTLQASILNGSAWAYINGQWWVGRRDGRISIIQGDNVVETITTPVSTTITKIKYLNGIYTFMSGTSVYQSKDKVTWTRVSFPVTPADYNYGGGYWCVASSSGSYVSKTLGSGWTAVSKPSSMNQAGWCFVTSSYYIGISNNHDGSWYSYFGMIRIPNYTGTVFNAYIKALK